MFSVTFCFKILLDFIGISEKLFISICNQDKEYDVPTVVFAHKEIDSIETDGEYKIIPLGETGRSHVEIKTGIGNHKITLNFK